MKFKNKILPLSIFVIVLLLFSCSTIQFGKESQKTSPINKVENKNEPLNDDIKEYDLSYSYKVMGIPVNGKKSVVETFYRDNNTDFIFISFPKIGILKAINNGKTFQPTFFNFKTLNTFFGYNKDYDDININTNKNREILPKKLFSHFVKSDIDNKKIAISMGNYIFTSIDYGDKWNAKQLNWDVNNYQINSMFGSNDELIVFMNDKIMVSKDWGKNWKTETLKIGKTKLQYISAIYDKNGDRFLISLKFPKEKDSILSRNSYLFFKGQGAGKESREIKDKKDIESEKDLKNSGETLSGLYYTTNFGKVIKKLDNDINFPVSLWNYNETIYFSNIYPTKMYDEKFTEEFYLSNLYTKGILNKTSTEINEYLDKKLYLNNDFLEIIDIKNPIIAKIENDEIKKIKETNFENVYNAIKQLEKIDYLKYSEKDKKVFFFPNLSNEDRDFYYDYNPYQIFMSWTNFSITAPIIYTKHNNRYIRIVPEKKFLEIFFNYAFENEIRINSTNPLLRKITDNRFFSPALDPTDGFPVSFEYSLDGITWEKILDEKHIKIIVDPLATKRSGLYWYKNIEQKKSTRLELSFGFEEGASYFCYPQKLISYNKNYMLIILNYFSIIKEYKDCYLIHGE